jgi:hypothetical protein
MLLRITCFSRKNPSKIEYSRKIEKLTLYYRTTKTTPALATNNEKA